MGRRVFRVSPELFVEFFKGHADAQRTFTVDNPLPDDARVVEERWLTRPPHAEGEHATLGIVLESAEWPGVAEELYPDPRVTVHFGEEARHGPVR